jgi:hypothetical protein
MILRVVPKLTQGICSPSHSPNDNIKGKTNELSGNKTIKASVTRKCLNKYPKILYDILRYWYPYLLIFIFLSSLSLSLSSLSSLSLSLSSLSSLSLSSYLPYCNPYLPYLYLPYHPYLYLPYLPYLYLLIFLIVILIFLILIFIFLIILIFIFLIFLIFVFLSSLS